MTPDPDGIYRCVLKPGAPFRYVWNEATKDYDVVPIDPIPEPQLELTPKEQEEFVKKFFGLDRPCHEQEQARLRLRLGEQDHRDFTALSE